MFLSKRAYFRVKAEPNAFGGGVSPMGGGGGPGGSGGANSATAGPTSGVSSDSIKQWRCPICRRVQPDGGALHDHMQDVHQIRDIG